MERNDMPPLNISALFNKRPTVLSLSRLDDPVLPFVSRKLEQAATDGSGQCRAMAPNSSRPQEMWE
jgi:hypothetical protein